MAAIDRITENHILIVDHDRVTGASLRGLLAAEGYAVTLCEAGSEALAQARCASPDLVLLDVFLPGMDGYEVCRAFRGDPALAETPIVLLTALGDRDSWIKGLEMGADDFLSKPVDRVALLARVRAITRLNRFRRLRAEPERPQQSEQQLRARLHDLELLNAQILRTAHALEETVSTRTSELAAERDRIRAILEALGEAAFVTDTRGLVQYANPAAADLTGYEREELVGVHLNRWHPDRRVEQVFDRLAQDPGSPLKDLWWEGELVGRRKDGSYFDAMLTIAPLPAPLQPDRAIGFVGVQRDITPLKEAERMKHRFASNVSHELRTPLSVITLLSGNLDALGERLSPEKRSAMIKDIRRHAQVLDELITDVLEMSSIDSGRLSPELQILDLAPLLRDEMQRLAPLAERRQQQLTAGGDASLMVRADGRQLRRVVRNLINNAVKYSPEGGHIDCRWQRLDLHPDPAPDQRWPGVERLAPGPWAAMSVTDDGIGIDAADQERIFERFYRVNSQSNIPGTGLGLAITRELVQLQSGRVALASTPGKGSVFAVYLPVCLPVLA